MVLWMALGAVPLVLVLGDFIYWRVMERQLQAGLEAWVANTRAAGWTVTAGAGFAGGWPLAATLTVPDVTISGGAAVAPGGVEWRSPRVRLRLDLRDPAALHIEPEGRQRLRIGQSGDLMLNAGGLDATLSGWSASGAGNADILVRQMALDGPAGLLSVGLLQAHAGLAVPANFSLSAEAIDLPPTGKWPLGSHVSSVSMEGTLSGRYGSGDTPLAWATTWRDNGGSLEIHRFALGWGPLGLAATATLALDDQLQPMGAGVAHLHGYDSSLEALAANGFLTRSAVVAAKAVLSLLAPSPEDDASAGVEVPLTLQYRTLSIRQIPLVRLPELDWPPP
jgi:hypothetical protein